MQEKICINCGSKNVSWKKIEGRNFYFCEECNQTNPFSLTKKHSFKTGESKKGKIKHFSVGALVKRLEGGKIKYLLIDRTNFPFGFAGIAGHIEKGESKEQALKKEVKEEAGMDITSSKLLFNEELGWNKCSMGIGVHEWFLYEVKAKGKLVKNKEAKSIAFYSPKEIKKLELEPVWDYWLKKLKII